MVVRQKTKHFRHVLLRYFNMIVLTQRFLKQPVHRIKLHISRKVNGTNDRK